MARYEERLTAYQSVDFDDLIGLPLKLLRDFPEVREKWQKLLGHVLVDEYQDTNATQYELLKLLVGERGRFTAVGDDDQSIYGWRGATLDNLRKLPQDYPTAEGGQAGAELPLHQRHPARRQQRHPAQSQAVPQDAVLGTGRGRAGAHGRLRQRGARGRTHGGAHPVDPRQRRAQGLEGLRGAVPRQPPGARLRAGAAQGADPVQGVGRPELLRPRRDPRPVRLAAPVGEQRRRPGLPAQRDHAQARHRPPDAGQPGHLRQPVQAACSRRCSRPRCPAC
jgi:hypothetical protein